MIRLLDHTSDWRENVRQAALNWASVGYRIEYVPMSYAVPGEEPLHDEPNIVVCTDWWPPRENWNAYSSWVPGWNGQWRSGWCHFIVDPGHGPFAIATAVHEIGHALGLYHPDDVGYAGFVDTVMTPIPSKLVPTGWDLARAAIGWVEPTPPPAPTPKKKKSKHKRKKH